LTPPKREIGKTENKQLKRRKSFVDYTCQMIKMIMDWLGNIERDIFFTADGNFATFSISDTCIGLNAKFISRLRWNASLYETNFSQGTRRRRVKGKKLPSPEMMLNDPDQKWMRASVKWYGGLCHEVEYLTGVAIWYKAGKKPLRIKWVILRDPLGKSESTVLMCTDEKVPASKIIEIFVLRWNIEVTFEEVHDKLGWGSQRHWSDKAIARITPSLLALYSMTCLIGLSNVEVIKKEETAWYKKKEATYSDVLKGVKKKLWEEKYKSSTGLKAEDEKIITELIDLLSKAA
jgi:Transposase DDE domain